MRSCGMHLAPCAHGPFASIVIVWGCRSHFVCNRERGSKELVNVGFVIKRAAIAHGRS